MPGADWSVVGKIALIVGAGVIYVVALITGSRPN